MRYSVDRIENGKAVCEDEKQNIINIEMSLLPDGVREGDILEVADGKFAIRRNDTEIRRKQMADLQASLFKK